ncbi:shufflon system plasmid conjugative transfer pilus tip adhesin PilV, partial [Salmonella enterica]
VSAGGILTLDKINVAGTACPVNGAISRDTAGATLSCQSGLWRSGGKVSAFEMVQGNDACGKYVYSKAYCPAGKQLIS